MIEERELVTLITGIAVLVFMLLRRQELEHIPNGALLLSSFAVLVSGWAFTVLEGFTLPDLLNLLEHACYTISTVLLAVWAWKTFILPNGNQ